jgi:multisubunit Na+/H+ antiporter MnhE subunit
MGVLRSIVQNVIGLIVDDGLVVLGAIVALLVTWLLTSIGPDIPHLLIGVILFLLVAVSLLASLLRAARDAHRHAVEPPGDAA